tara:strand:- start:4736 stop:7813 length:3078 start_codon:yes stop_codon:yes gene_type:complete
MDDLITPLVTDHLPISLRAFAKPDAGKDRSKNASNDGTILQGPSDWTLVFDCETTTDASQKLRFGTYQVHFEGGLFEAGIFFDADSIAPDEYAVLQEYADRNELKLISRYEFIHEVFYDLGFDLRAAIVGFNLPFDLSRIAIGHGSARKSFAGGFSLNFSDNKRLPNVQIKHQSSRAAFIQFAGPFKGSRNRSKQKRGEKEIVRRGHFIDVKTLASALFARSFSLKSLSDFLTVENGKLDFDEFDGPITEKMIDYAVRDTQATWECYEKLIAKYNALGLHQTLPEKIYSEAGVGKAYLKEMAIRPWQQCQPDFPDAILGKIMASYFGGRSEIRIRREMRQVMLCDFLSMYPTVCTLMGLWRNVIATGIDHYDATDEATNLLESVTLEMLQSKAIWKKLAILVRVKPDCDIFPVRTEYGYAKQATIGLNYLTAKRPLWFTLADCILAKLLGGKSPEIIEAISFKPKRKQRGLQNISIGGDDNYFINPAKDDFYKRLIELRHETKSEMHCANALELDHLDTAQHNLKILANSTSYGIFVEINVSDAKSGAMVAVHSGDDDAYKISPSKLEKPGTYFNPLLASLITGAARLMLAVTERLALDKGLEWSFCDTDSMALAKPAAMPQSDFANKVAQIIDWFDKLNPYDFGGSILKSEAVNFGLNGDSELAPLYCYAISAKRYALFNLDDGGKPILRKASAHGLGHLRAPYDERNPATGIAPPQDKLSNIGVERWQHDLWIKIIEAALSGNPNEIDLSYHPNLQLPAISRYAATSPAILRWFKQHNSTRAYADQVKPFGFLTALSMQKLDCSENIIDAPGKRKSKKSQIKPIAPFTIYPAIAAQTAFNRNGGASVPIERLQSYAQSLAQYHLHPENKFLNGNYLDIGTTLRRYIQMTGIANIGKEANDWERQVHLGYDSESQPAYSYSPVDVVELQRELRRLCKRYSKSQLAQRGEITVDSISQFLNANSDSNLAMSTASQMQKIIYDMRKVEKRDLEEIALFKARCEKYGLRETARRLGVDPSNLKRKLS